MEEPAELIPPENFSMVENSLYRGGFPKKRHFPFLKRLRLKSILYVALSQRSLPHQSHTSHMLLRIGLWCLRTTLRRTKDSTK